jgi:hypothetical protein
MQLQEQLGSAIPNSQTVHEPQAHTECEKTPDWLCLMTTPLNQVGVR